jgi:hypothetical protein
MSDCIEKIFQKWLFSEKQHKSLEEIYLGISQIDFSGLINAFVKRLSEINYSFTKSEQVSGAICFYGSVFVSLLNTGKIEQIEHLFTFALCYMLVDHFLDDKNNTEKTKLEIMEELQKFIQNGEVGENSLIQAAGKRYQELINDIPEVKKEILNLFDAEWKGHQISKSKSHSRDIYKEIALKKGSGTARVIACIIGLELEPNDHLGALIQLVDDCLDVSDDADLNIFTLARYDLEKTNWDNYILETCLEIEKLDKVYNFFKPILLTGLILGVHDNPNSVSEELSALIQKYDFFNTTSKNYLNEWFYNKLYQYIDDVKLNRKKIFHQ